VIALDTNILVYAAMAEDTQRRHSRAIELLRLLGPQGAIVPLQAIGEFLNVCSKKAPLALAEAGTRANLWMALFLTPAAQPADYLEAVVLAHRYRLQFFDSLMLVVSRRAGAIYLMSEDMQHGQKIDGIEILNPFLLSTTQLEVILAQG
jgi:predicted nucleic acid-binding protein